MTGREQEDEKKKKKRDVLLYSRNQETTVSRLRTERVNKTKMKKRMTDDQRVVRKKMGKM